jgi:nucleolar protein 15
MSDPVMNDLNSESSDEEETVEQHTMKEQDFVALEGLAAATKKRLKKGGANDNDSSSVIYLGHIPHGFYEKEMRGFFTQFGEILRIRLSRNKKTGNSKHYAFIEFQHDNVAQIVADTMDGYYLFDKRLVSHVVPAKKVHEKMFAGANKKFRPIPWRLIARQRHNATKTMEQEETKVKRLVKREKRKRKKLKELGIDYEFEGYAGQIREKPKKIKFDE